VELADLRHCVRQTGRLRQTLRHCGRQTCDVSSRGLVCWQFFVRLDHIRKCFTQKGGIFVLEEYNPKTRQTLQRKYKSAMADQICYSVLCVFSYIAAGPEHKKPPPRPSSGTR